MVENISEIDVVLILVLMDNVNTRLWKMLSASNFCLNPCFNG